MWFLTSTVICYTERWFDLIFLIYIRSCVLSVNDLRVQPFIIICDNRTFFVSAQHKWRNLPPDRKIVVSLKRILEPQVFHVAFHPRLASSTKKLHMQCV